MIIAKQKIVVHHITKLYKNIKMEDSTSAVRKYKIITQIHIQYIN